MHKKRTDSNDVANLAKNDTLGFHALKNSEKNLCWKIRTKMLKNHSVRCSTGSLHFVKTLKVWLLVVNINAETNCNMKQFCQLCGHKQIRQNRLSFCCRLIYLKCWWDARALSSSSFHHVTNQNLLPKGNFPLHVNVEIPRFQLQDQIIYALSDHNLSQECVFNWHPESLVDLATHEKGGLGFDS